jgi:hypothetical protein
MSTYNIKLEDKAAFINRLDKLGVGVDSYEIKDDKLKGAFEFTVNDPVVDKIVKTILKQSPKINTIKEMKTKMTKKQLAEIIREELKAAKEAKKSKVEESQLNEDFTSQLVNFLQNPDSQTLFNVGTAVGTGTIAAFMKKINDAVKKGEGEKAKKSIDRTLGSGEIK